MFNRFFETMDLLPQDRVVVLEESSEPGVKAPVEAVYYVECVDTETGRIHLLDPFGHRASADLDHIVEFHKATDPITVTVASDTWDRFGGNPDLRGHAIRAVAVGMCDNRPTDLIIPLSSMGEPGRWLHLDLRLLRLSPGGKSIPDDQTLLRKLPAKGHNNHRACDPETERRRVYRTAGNRISRFLDGFRGIAKQQPPPLDPSLRQARDGTLRPRNS